MLLEITKYLLSLAKAKKMKILKNEKNIGTHGTEPMDLRGGQVGLEKHTTPPPKKKT